MYARNDETMSQPAECVDKRNNTLTHSHTHTHTHKERERERERTNKQETERVRYVGRKLSIDLQ